MPVPAPVMIAILPSEAMLVSPFPNLSYNPLINREQNYRGNTFLPYTAFTICAVALYQQKTAKINAPQPAIFSGVAGEPNVPIIPNPSIVNVMPISVNPPKSNLEICHAAGKSRNNIMP